jgi:hypothetical protein
MGTIRSKTVVRCRFRRRGGFDSHALPPTSLPDTGQLRGRAGRPRDSAGHATATGTSEHYGSGPSQQ